MDRGSERESSYAHRIPVSDTETMRETMDRELTP